MYHYIVNVCMALTCLANTLRGQPYHCPVCATEYNNKRQQKLNIVWILDRLFGQGHCMEAWVSYQLKKRIIK